MNRHRHNSVMAHSQKLLELRQRIGWTQEQASAQTGFSDRLIRKLERGVRVRRKTLHAVLNTYHRALNCFQWRINDFIVVGETNESTTHSLEEQTAFRIVEDYLQNVFNNRNTDWIEKSVSERAVLKTAGGNLIGREAFENRAKIILNGFSQICFTVEHVFVKDQRSVFFWDAKMRHTGEFLNIPPTNKWIQTRGVLAATFEDEMIATFEHNWDVDQVIRKLKGLRLRNW